MNAPLPDISLTDAAPGGRPLEWVGMQGIDLPVAVAEPGCRRDVHARADVQEEWNRDVQEALAGTVWNAGGCSSYYLDQNGRNSAIYPWTTLDLRRRLRSFDRAAFATTPRVAERTPATAAA